MKFKLIVYNKKGKAKEKDFTCYGSDAEARFIMRQVKANLDMMVARGAICSYTLGDTPIDDE